MFSSPIYLPLSKLENIDFVYWCGIANPETNTFGIFYNDLSSKKILNLFQIDLYNVIIDK